MKSKGFTLIELLVVISVIALLSSVVLSSLNSARTKAADAAAKAAMKQMRTQAQQYRDTAPNFGISIVACNQALFNDAQMQKLQTNILSFAASGATLSCRTGPVGNNWALSVSALKGGGTWCIDNSQGWFKAGTVNANGQCQ